MRQACCPKLYTLHISAVIILAVYYLHIIDGRARSFHRSKLVEASTTVISPSLAATLAAKAAKLHVWMRQERALRIGASRHLHSWQRRQPRSKRHCSRSPLLAALIMPLPEEARLAGEGGAEHGRQSKTGRVTEAKTLMMLQRLHFGWCTCNLTCL